MSSQFSMAIRVWRPLNILCCFVCIPNVLPERWPRGIGSQWRPAPLSLLPFCRGALSLFPRCLEDLPPQTWPPILTELVGINNYLNSKILTLRPCRRTLWQSQASCLLPCRLDNILIGSVACCVLLFDFCFANIVCWGVYWLNGF